MSFSPINPENIQITSDSIVSTLWSNNQTVLSGIYKDNSVFESYLNVYNTSLTSSNSEIQFSLNYGHILGSGSYHFNPLVPSNTITKAIYGQIRTLINGDENTPINFGTGNTESPDVYIININRARYKEKLFLNTFNLLLSSPSGIIQLTNNSKDSNIVNYCDAGRVFNVVSGSNGNSIIGGGNTISGSYGKFLPDVGLILLNPQALSLPYISGGLELNIGEANNISTYNNNVDLLFNSINDGAYFSLNSEETLTSDYIFINVKNQEYNYSTNPSIIDNNGEFYYSSLINNPETFITTIGLYNDSNELLAVAKMSKPLKKNFTKEQNIRVKLDF